MSARVPQKPNTQTHTQTIQAGKRENATKQIHSKCKLEKGENATNQIQNKYTENPSMERGGNATNKIHRKSRHGKRGNAKRNTCDGLGVPPVSFSRHSLQNWL